MTDTQRRSLRGDIAEVLNDDNDYSPAVQTWAAVARDLLGDLDAAEAERAEAMTALARHSCEPQAKQAARTIRAETAVQRVREMHEPERPGTRRDRDGHEIATCALCVDANGWPLTWPCDTIRAIEGDA